ncbi:peroxisomal copper amine oxidase [Fomitiporia mediterranea MF3/22]|uniref:peroxisomal copper amine oxidase n=1 Tax=Fomitiporia mediterranea (strain MF3/22) TaxID=694068 RepID=UPI00044086E3|nr:peroxisomal copper amine oxidase [Fomitiporia mediterranea MF3/22]EJD00280.1 peroxisomal copper amine oxidase [Fomitiporia mediterranea MF3/22]
MASILANALDTGHHVPGTATRVQHAPKSGASFSSNEHPLDPLSPDEITAISLEIRSHAAGKNGIKALKFITSNLIPPPKRDVLAFLGVPLTTGEKPAAAPPRVDRRAGSDFIDLITGDAYNVTLGLKDGKWIVDTLTKLPKGTQPQISVEELAMAEDVVKKDARVIALVKELGLETENIACDGWSIGYDERFPTNMRVQQALVFARFGTHENLYAHPLDFVPVLDSNACKVIHIDFPPHRDASGKLSVSNTLPRPLEEDTLTNAKRDRIPVPTETFDFLPDLRGKNYKPRDDIKPLHIIQPEGVSFTMNGHELEWQKWKMHISFHHREGIVISTVTYNDEGTLRPVFYRLSLAEMIVPYGAPEFPHPRKFAFDAGEYGMGTMANDLSLGCDCVGAIHYLPGCYVGHNGSAIKIKNAICIHEEDNGLLWKHTDYRPGGRSFAARSRRLVVSMCCTLANYEYIWNYRFYQDGTVEFEVRLTGILQVYVGADNEANPYGTTVAKNINAHYHQHLFSLRVDPMVDGLSNSMLELDVVPAPGPTGSDENFAGNAFTTESRILKTSLEGMRDYSFDRDRRWRIVNPNVAPHYSTGAQPGYGIAMKGAVQTLLAKEKSWIQKRAFFGTKALWVVKDKEDADGSRIYPSGKYVPQTREEPTDSLGSWAKENANIDNEDIVLYLTLGTNHIPRPEDWPVMPSEHLNVYFKPQNFFRTNPSLDIPAANDPKSCAAFSEGQESNSNCCA